VVQPLRNKKGVSEIVATVLMIMIVTLIGFTVLLYGMGYFSGTTSARNLQTQTTIDSLEERFIIVDANFINSSQTLSVTVYNYGQVDIKIGSIYLNGTQLSGVLTTPIYPNQNAQINGSYTNGTFVPGIYQIEVVSTLGNYYENYYYYPS
jgi:flagellin-like protein